MARDVNVAISTSRCRLLDVEVAMSLDGVAYGTFGSDSWHDATFRGADGWRVLHLDQTYEVDRVTIYVGVKEQVGAE